MAHLDAEDLKEVFPNIIVWSHQLYAITHPSFRVFNHIL